MLRSSLQALLRGYQRRRAERRLLASRFVPGIDALETRLTPAITAAFLPQAGILTVFGDAQNNTITVSRNAAGNILVNGGNVTILGGTPTVVNTALIQIFGQAGNDQISLNEANG